MNSCRFLKTIQLCPNNIGNTAEHDVGSSTYYRNKEFETNMHERPRRYCMEVERG